MFISIFLSSSLHLPFIFPSFSISSLGRHVVGSLPADHWLLPHSTGRLSHCLEWAAGVNGNGPIPNIYKILYIIFMYISTNISLISTISAIFFIHHLSPTASHVWPFVRKPLRQQEVPATALIAPMPLQRASNTVHQIIESLWELVRITRSMGEAWNDMEWHGHYLRPQQSHSSVCEPQSSHCGSATNVTCADNVSCEVQRLRNAGLDLSTLGQQLRQQKLEKVEDSHVKSEGKREMTFEMTFEYNDLDGPQWINIWINGSQIWITCDHFFWCTKDQQLTWTPRGATKAWHSGSLRAMIQGPGLELSHLN